MTSLNTRGWLFAEVLFPLCSLLPLDVVATTDSRSIPCPAPSPTEALCPGNILPSPEGHLVLLIHSSIRASLQGCSTESSSLLRTLEKSLVLLLPGPDCGLGKPCLVGAELLEKANVQVLGAKRNACHRLYKDDPYQGRNRLLFPLGHLPIALNVEFDTFTMRISKQGQGRKAREWAKEPALEMLLGKMRPHHILPIASICTCFALSAKHSAWHHWAEELWGLRQPFPAYPVPVPCSSTAGGRLELIKTFM